MNKSITSVVSERWNQMCIRPVNRLEEGQVAHEVDTEDPPVRMKDGLHYRVIILDYDLEELKDGYKLD